MGTRALVILPTYNEKDNVIPLSQGILDASGQLEILVVDDNSPDGTGDIVAAAMADEPRLQLLRREGKQGLGSAYREGFKYALGTEAEYIVQMDADFSHSPSYIPDMLDHVSNYDVVVGSRYVGDGQLDERWSWWRWFLSNTRGRPQSV